MKRTLTLVVGLLVSVVFLWLLLRDKDLAGLGQAMKELSIPHLFLALAFLGLGYLARILRWWTMLRALDPAVPFKVCVWPFITSIAVNNVLPLRVGDVVRVVGFRKQLGLPVVRILGTMVIERILDLLVLLAIFFVGLLGLKAGGFSPRFVTGALWLTGGTLAMVSLYFLLAPWMERLVEKLAHGAFFRDRGLTGFILEHGTHLTQSLALVRSPRRLMSLVVLSVVCWGFEGAVFVTVALSLGISVEPTGVFFSMATGTLATLIPSSPGYLGTFDFFTAKALAAWGGSPELGAAFAFTVHAVLWLPLTFAGLFYLLMKGYRFWKIRPDSLKVPDDRGIL